MPKLSIIIPVYNVEPYLQRCIDSILAQTFTDFEAILIDDGSPDSCRRIIDEYAQKNSRIIAIHQQNQGVSAARNAGLKAARGEYIGFVDPDDWIEPEMYAHMMQCMQQPNCDIAVCAWVNNYDDGTEKPHANILPSQSFDREGFAEHLFDMPPTVAGSCCNKLFRKALIASPFRTEYIICEDNIFLAIYVCSIRGAVLIDKPYYHVFNRSNSATRQNPDKIALGLPARREIIGLAAQISHKCKMRAERVFLDQCITYCSTKMDSSTPYYHLARSEFLEYSKSHLLSILCNSELSFKQKLLLAKEFMRLCWTKGN